MWLPDVHNKKNKKKTIFLYKDATGRERYRKVRLDWWEDGNKHKTMWFEQRNADSKWGKGLPPDRHLYNLPALLKAPADQFVFIVGGEKCVDILVSIGLVAVCNDAGEGVTWPKEFLTHFKDRTVCILPDNDYVGRDFGERLVTSLSGVAERVQVLALDGLAEKEDVYEWLEKPGNDKERLLNLTQNLFSKPLSSPNGALVNPVGDAFEGEDALQEEEEDTPPDWRPFPLDLLPPVLSDYIRHAAEALVCDPAFVALPVIVATGGVIGNSRIISLKESWPEPCVFWGCVIADSSTLKSPAFDIAKTPLTMIEKELRDEYGAQQEQWEKEVALWEEKGGKREKAWAEKETYACPKEPVQGRLLIDDITVETVAKLLSHNPKGLVLAMDELRGWFGSFGKYKTGGAGGGDLSFWLELHRAGSKTIDRKTGDQKSIFISRGAVSVMGTTQPKIAARTFTNDFFDSGLVSRLLLIKPPRKKKEWSEAVIPGDVGHAFRHLIRSLFYLDREASKEADFTPKVLNFSPLGKKAWIEFYNRWGGVQWDADGEHSSCLAKLEAYCARFALLLCEVEFHAGIVAYEIVNESHVARAQALVEWFSHEASRVYRFLQSAESQIEVDQLMELIQRKGGKITCRQLLRANPARFKSMDTCKTILENLVTRRQGRWEHGGVTEKGGRPTNVFCLLN